jgi:hypothetical protein
VTPRAALLAVAAGATLAGCSSDGEEPLPPACRAAGPEIRAALSQAPGRVELDGTPLSGCLVKSSDPGEIQEVGSAFLAVASELGPAAAERPEGGQALRLGYLVGAARRGAERTQGIHSELVRRLEQEAVAVAAGSDAYARGVRIGRRRG